MKVIIFVGLMMSLAPAVGMAYVFYQLGVKGAIIVPDYLNILELWLAMVVLLSILVAIGCFISLAFRTQKEDNK